MTAVIVGGDRIKSIEKVVAGKGVSRVEHWAGRKPGDLRKIIPKDTALVVLICDYLSHSLARKVRQEAENMGLPILYCRNSVGHFCSKLHELIDSGGFAAVPEEQIACCRRCTEKRVQ